MGGIAAFGIGSTNFRYALGTERGELLSEIEIEPTRPRRLVDQIIEALTDLEEQSTGAVEEVAISTAGLVDSASGLIEEIDTAAGEVVTDVRVREAVRREFDLPTYLENDCNAAALGEYEFGAGRGYESLVHVTIGTGIGAGIVENGSLLRGEAGHSGEVGYYSVETDGELESFGVPGAWEAYCSGRGIPRFVENRLAEETRETPLLDVESLAAQDVFVSSRRGDPVARECLDDIARYNAAGVGALVNTCNPGVVTLGGGVVLNNADAVVSGIREYVDEYLFVERPEIRTTPLGDEIGVYGALALPRNRNGTGDGTARC